MVAGSQVTLDGSASSDEDPTQTLSYTWTQTAGPHITLTDSSALSPSFTSTIAGTYTFSLVVTDNLGSVSALASVTITLTNDQPIADAGENRLVLAGPQVILDGSGSSDPDAHSPLTYSWIQTSGTSVTLTGGR